MGHLVHRGLEWAGSIGKLWAVQSSTQRWHPAHLIQEIPTKRGRPGGARHDLAGFEMEVI